MRQSNMTIFILAILQCVALEVTSRNLIDTNEPDGDEVSKYRMLVLNETYPEYELDETDTTNSIPHDLENMERDFPDSVGGNITEGNYTDGFDSIGSHEPFANETRDFSGSVGETIPEDKDTEVGPYKTFDNDTLQLSDTEPQLTVMLNDTNYNFNFTEEQGQETEPQMHVPDGNSTDQEQEPVEPTPIKNLLTQLLDRLDVPLLVLDDYRYITAVRSPDGSLYVPQHHRQSTREHLATLLGFAEQIVVTKNALAETKEEGEEEEEEEEEGEDKEAKVEDATLSTTSAITELEWSELVDSNSNVTTHPPEIEKDINAENFTSETPTSLDTLTVEEPSIDDSDLSGSSEASDTEGESKTVKNLIELLGAEVDLANLTKRFGDADDLFRTAQTISKPIQSGLMETFDKLLNTSKQLEAVFSELVLNVTDI